MQYMDAARTRADPCSFQTGAAYCISSLHLSCTHVLAIRAQSSIRALWITHTSFTALSKVQSTVPTMAMVCQVVDIVNGP